MKKGYLKLLTACMFSLLWAASCDNTTPGGGDDEPTITEQRNQWIYSQLSEWYLWRDDVLAKKPNYSTADYETFFNSLLSTNREDGYVSGSTHYFYSFIDREPVSTRTWLSSNKSFGFEFMAAQISGSNNVAIIILYVVPGSPADLADIKRGYVITAINGTTLTTSNYSSLFPLLLTEAYTGTALRAATVAGLYLDDDSVAQSFSASLNPAFVIDNSVHYSTVVALNNGKKAGYLVYNSFESGYPDIKNSDFNNKLKQAFREFQTAGVSELILDLRYNGGGLVRCAQLMTSMVNTSFAGQVFQTYKFNTYVTNKYMGGTDAIDKFLTMDQMKNTTTSYEGEIISVYGSDPAADLGLSRVYILTTNHTASSSEAVLNSLRGILGAANVIQIGETTLGKAVGMSQISNGGEFGSYAYHMWPITFVSYNKNGVRTPVGGWEPSIKVDDFNGGLLYQFGDVRDPLLGAAIDHIEGRTPKSARVMKSSGGSMQKLDLPSSLDHKPNRNILKTGFDNIF